MVRLRLPRSYDEPAENQDAAHYVHDADRLTQQENGFSAAEQGKRKVEKRRFRWTDKLDRAVPMANGNKRSTAINHRRNARVTGGTESVRTRATTKLPEQITVAATTNK